MEIVLGSTHPEYINTLLSIGDIYSAIGYYDKGLRYQLKSMKMLKIMFG